MKRKFWITGTLLVLSFLFLPAFNQDSLPPAATLASVAHATGIRGGDLAEALDFPRAIDKEKPLVEMGVTPDQLRQALTQLGVSVESMKSILGTEEVNTSMTISQIGAALGINGKIIAHDLGLDVNVDKETPVEKFGITREKLDIVVSRILEHGESGWVNLKYPGFVLVSLFALAFLLKWGIPKDADPKRRKKYYSQKVYVIVLVLVLLVLGFVLGKSPNPMEGAVKFFKATVGLYDAVPPKLLLLLFFFLLAIIANKVICGWGCPFGALEELIYMLPIFKKAKRRKLPFWVTNSFRAAFFGLFLLVLYGQIGGQKGLVTYHYLNPFNLFNFDFSSWTVPIAIGIYLAASFFFYRPFCRFICPFGFLSWFTEKISVSRVRIDFERCNDCMACDKACPLTAAGDRLKRKGCPLIVFHACAAYVFARLTPSITGRPGDTHRQKRRDSSRMRNSLLNSG